MSPPFNERTAAVIINSPSNPCGTMYSPQELRALADVLAGHEHVTIIADEIYEKLIFGGIDFLSLGSVASIADRAECPMYAGLELEPQLGLVPIGRDSDSGLWEFAHVQTGEVPIRDADGRLVLTEETCLVLVLVPDGVAAR